MEESISFIKEVEQGLNSSRPDIRSYSPLTLAYIGDGVFELIIRTLIVEKGQRAANTLHKHTTKIVCADTQAAIIQAIMENLTEEELTIYRRGKNAKSNSVAKNSSLSDYKKATGFEAICGYLYLQDNVSRIVELVKLGLDKLELEV